MNEADESEVRRYLNARVQPVANLPLDYLKWEAEGLLEAVNERLANPNAKDQDKINEMRARIMVHLRHIQATANNVLPPADELP